MPIKIIKNKETFFALAQMNAVHCIGLAIPKEIEDKIILFCILKQWAASYMQKQNTLLELTQIDNNCFKNKFLDR